MLAAIMAAALGLTGCTTTDASTGAEVPGWVSVHYVDLPGNGRVLCIWEKDGYGGGLSCDWTGARR